MDLMHLLQLALHFDRHLGAVIGQYGPAVYAMLFAIIFFEIGFLPLFFLPGDPLIFICGAFAATHALNVWIVMPVLFAAAVGGSIVNYATGRAIGEKVYTANIRWIDRNALRKAHAFYETALPTVEQLDVRALFKELKAEEVEHIRMVEEILAKLPAEAAIGLTNEDED